MPRSTRNLLADGALRLRLDAALLPSATRWIPRFLHGESEPLPRPPRLATIELRRALGPSTPPPGHPPRTLRLGQVQGWLMDEGRRLRLAADSTAAGGTVHLPEMTAELRAPIPLRGADTNDPGLELFTTLTIAAAALLSRLGRALLHAAAVESPDGRAWLLVGNAMAGKTTTTLNLIRAGWRYLSDDHVVLAHDDSADEVVVEGWPRVFHPDAGWEEGEITGRRVDLDPRRLGVDRWVRRAPLGGIFFPEVRADHATALHPLSGADALTRLVRQSPWFLSDPAAAAGVLALLRGVASLPAHQLSLGHDTYCDPLRLVQSIMPAIEPVPPLVRSS